jgi:transposase
MMSAADSLPDDVATLKAMLVAAQAACLEAQAKARNAEAEARARALLIEQMKFTIAKLRHERFGQSSEQQALGQERDRPGDRLQPQTLACLHPLSR